MRTKADLKSATPEERRRRVEVEIKDLKALDGGPGTFSGYGSVFGNVDLQGDIVVNGAFAQSIEPFVKDGFISWGHDWNRAVATIDVAREDDTGLYIECTFHTDDYSQQCRQIAMERLARGKSMGLSIGFMIEDVDFSDQFRLITQAKLFEVSLVLVPANPKAQVQGIKTLERIALAALGEEPEIDTIIDATKDAASSESTEPTLATGGVVTAGQMSIVGERGCELLTLPVAGTIIVTSGLPAEEVATAVAESVTEILGSISADSTPPGEIVEASAETAVDPDDDSLPGTIQTASASAAVDELPSIQLTFADHANAVLAAVEEFAVRAKALAELRAKSNRRPSDAALTRITDLNSSLAGLNQTLAEIVADPVTTTAAVAPAESDSDGKATSPQPEIVAETEPVVDAEAAEKALRKAELLHQRARFERLRFEQHI